jgi:hypothetical protein
MVTAVLASTPVAASAQALLDPDLSAQLGATFVVDLPRHAAASVAGRVQPWRS